jgi:hypothetical protein
MQPLAIQMARARSAICAWVGAAAVVAWATDGSWATGRTAALGPHGGVHGRDTGAVLAAPNDGGAAPGDALFAHEGALGRGFSEAGRDLPFGVFWLKFLLILQSLSIHARSRCAALSP